MKKTQALFVLMPCIALLCSAALAQIIVHGAQEEPPAPVVSVPEAAILHAPDVAVEPAPEPDVPDELDIAAEPTPPPAREVTPDELAQRLVDGLRNSIEAAGLKSVAVTPFLRGGEDSQLIDSVIRKFEAKLAALGVAVVGSARVAEMLQTQLLKTEMLMFPPALKWLAGEMKTDGVIIGAVFYKPSPFVGAVLYDSKGNRLDLLAARDTLLVDKVAEEPPTQAAPEPQNVIVLKDGTRYTGNIIHTDGDYVLIETANMLMRVQKDQIVLPKAPPAPKAAANTASQVPCQALVNLKDGTAYEGTIFFDGGDFYLVSIKDNVIRIPKAEILSVAETAQKQVQ